MNIYILFVNDSYNKREIINSKSFGWSCIFI